MMPLPHAYISEVVQSIASVVGFALGIWAVWDARGDEEFFATILRREREIGRDVTLILPRFEIARVHVKSELSSVIAQTMLLVAGVTGMLLPPPDGVGVSAAEELLGVLVSRYAMAAVSTVLVYKSIIRRRGRINYLRRIRSGDPASTTHRIIPPSGMAPGAKR
jgi:hypothetical protein